MYCLLPALPSPGRAGASRARDGVDVERGGRGEHVLEDVPALVHDAVAARRSRSRRVRARLPLRRVVRRQLRPVDAVVVAHAEAADVPRGAVLGRRRGDHELDLLGPKVGTCIAALCKPFGMVIIFLTSCSRKSEIAIFLQ